MYKSIVLFIVMFFFASCASHESLNIPANKKVFAEEDMYIMFALRAEQLKDYKSASELFEFLYTKANKKEYLYRSLEDDLVAKRSKEVIKRVDENILALGFDAKLQRLKIVALVEENRLDEAIKLATSLASKTKEADDYLLASDVYIKRQEFDLAVRYLESAYAKENNEQILDKMSIVLYVNLGKKKEAIAHLETHSRMFGCSKLVCSRLIAFYSNDNNLEGLLSTYERLYALEKDESIAKKIIQIYAYEKNYFKLMLFLEKSGSDDELLLQLYSSSKNYKKAYPLASRLYKETSEVTYLGQSAIFEYESAKDKTNKKMLTSVIDKLDRVVEESKEPLYLNYLGYILIDHDIDIKKGMRYIARVIKQQPNSAYYLDSQAWGYYKLSQCKKAKKIMNRVEKLEGGDNPEVRTHIKEIDKCLIK